MGWIATNRPAGAAKLDFWNRQMCGSGIRVARAVRVVDVSERKNRAYLAVEEEWKSTTVVFAVVVRLRRRKGSFNLAYKDMEEFEGPYRAYDCPARILKRLTPLDRMVEVGFLVQDSASYHWAAEWRRRTEEHMAARRSSPSLRTGMVVRFDPPLPWSRGEAFSQLLCLDARRRIFAPVDNPSRHLRLRHDIIRAALASPANRPSRAA